MHKVAYFAGSLTAILVFSGPVFAETRTTYPQVRVELASPFTPDAAFENMRKQFINAVSQKNADALAALVAPGFVWTLNNALAEGYDAGRDAQHNFKVVFGFRAAGQDADGPVEGGPFWEALSTFANENTFYQIGDSGPVCGPIAANVVDEDVYERARERVEQGYEAEWYYAVRATSVARAPDDKGPPVGKVGTEAVPVIQYHPEGAATPTHYEVLLPSGRTGWVPANALRQMSADRLCYALTAKKTWGIAIFDSAEEQDQEQ